MFQLVTDLESQLGCSGTICPHVAFEGSAIKMADEIAALIDEGKTPITCEAALAFINRIANPTPQLGL